MQDAAPDGPTRRRRTGAAAGAFFAAHDLASTVSWLAAPSAADMAPTTPQTIYDRVRRVPPGYVTTYGDLCPGAPRHAGRALSQMPQDVPWWRVVRSDGTWPKGDEQRARLLAEDVPIRGRRVVMAEARIPPEAIL